MFSENRTLQSRAKTLRFRAGFVAFLLAIAGVAGSTARAQISGTGAISGTVTDPTGAIVVDAKVTATNVDTNVSTERTTTRAGDYNITPLIPGTYTVTVAATGFEGYKQENVTVDALVTVAVNVKLTVGQATETVTVTSAPPLLETTDATLGGVMDNEMYSNLPLEMGAGGNSDQRRATDFAYLMPGVSNVFTGSGNPTDATTGVNGSPNGVQEMYIEGIDLPEADGVGDNRFTWTAISVDSVNQFQIQTAGVGTQYAGQGTQNYSIKSGGNAIHGSLYEYNRNTLFDAWQFTSKVPTLRPNGVFATVKPREIQNEFGLVISAPIIKNKLFFFGNYGQYREQKGATISAMTIPTSAMLGLGTQNGVADFTGWAQANGGSNCKSIASEGTGGTANQAAGCDDIYDPSTETVGCTGNLSTGALCSRSVFHAMLNGTDQNDVIPASRLSQAAKYINQYWVPYETLASQTIYSNNLNYGTPTGLANWYLTSRIDYNQNAKNQVAIIVAFGRQASTGPNSTSGLGPPFNTSQSYHPVTNIDIIKDTYTISAHLVNQIAFGYGRYVSVSVTPDDAPQYSAGAIGLLGTPVGQASNGFPEITGMGGPTQAGYAWNSKANNTYTSTDNLQWEFGKHNFTFGAQEVLVQFNYYKSLGPTGPMDYGFSGAQTEGFPLTAGGLPTSGTSAQTNTGNGTASYMIGAVSSESVLDPFIPGLGTRWRDPSVWAQDDYKVTKNLTMNLGLRWDIMPSVTEAHNIFSFFNPYGQNSVTGNLGTLAFAGSGNSAQFCNCSNPSQIYYGNIAPRLGVAYSLNPKTVIRGSYGVSYARGDWTSGSQSGSPSTTGYTPSGASPTQPTPAFPIIYWDATACTNGTNAGVNCGFNGMINSPTPPTGGTSLAEYGTGNNSTTSSSGAGVLWFDKYKGDRTPQYINWTFGIQRQITHDISLTLSYVGSQGHFVSGGFDPLNRRNTLPTTFSQLAGYQVSGTTAAPCSGFGCTSPLISAKYSSSALALVEGYGFTPPNPYTGGVTYTTANGVTGYFNPYPQLGVSDTTNFNGNTNYHALQMTLRGRPSHGVDFMVNYTYSKSIDDVGTFRLVDNPRLDRSLSVTDQPQNLTATAVYSSPYGRGKSHLSNFIADSLARDWNLSGIFSYHSGPPIDVTGTGCAGTPMGQCMPTIVPGVNPRTTSYASPPGGIVSATGYSNSYSSIHHLNLNAFTVLQAANPATPTSLPPNDQSTYVGLGTAAYVPGTAARGATDNLWAMGAYDLDLGLKRSFPIWENVSLQFEADVVNVTNHTIWNSPAAVVGSGSTPDRTTGTPTYTWGDITSQNLVWGPRDWQLAARLNW